MEPEPSKLKPKKPIILILAVILIAVSITGAVIAFNNWSGRSDLRSISDVVGTEDPDVDSKYPAPWKDDYEQAVKDSEDPDEEPVDELEAEDEDEEDALSQAEAEESEESKSKDVPQDAGRVVHFLLMGIDKNKEVDAISVVSVHTGQKNARMISVNRDFICYWPSADQARNGHSRISEIYSFGGSHQMMYENVRRLTGISPHFFVQVDFNGLVNIVDTVGGITINGTRYNGAQALAYSRDRSGVSAGVRSRRHLDVIFGIMNEVYSKKSMSQALNLIVKGFGFVRSTNIGIGEAKDLYSSLEGLNPATTSFYNVPWSRGDYEDGKYYVYQ
ncbi:LCP family protein [Candidatus Contubernalis alkaliaceticus]|uniref:LCP family protein n=1 Tax=Candidatus Contubernalis alkaliaceticus TaxID=338645 RepID=UPI001F4C39BA|nr:LCP family protein [Candidatus Contubernalis alkalaceticus]UNC93482.1 LCP family protein [Candidatus Contubernalis alkalaceticus]